MSDGPDWANALPHGIADWPFGEAPVRDALPATLPDGSAWPRVCVITLAGPSDAVSASAASVMAQHYPDVLHLMVPPGADATAELRAALAEPATAFCLWLAPGELLAPGALAALCLEAWLTKAQAVAGLRVLFDRDVHGLDVPSLAGVRGTVGGEALFARDVATAKDFDPASPEAASVLWRQVAQGCVARIGRPVLLRREAQGEAAGGRSLSVVSLTDLGYQGGAGIAHRRLTEALSLAGHRITHLRLGDESPAAAAEWTDRFPVAEGAIRDGGHDLVLTGNLHGAVRNTGGLLGRLSQSVPVASVLHDLFALTGRCAHPKDCPVIATGCDARCPSPTEYPQLAPERIADAFKGKHAALAAAKAPLLLANSDWTEHRARALAPEAQVARIALAFPTGVFRPRDRAALRRELGLPPDDVLILFAAVIADAPDKGFDDLVATMARVARPGVGFVAVGRLDNPGVFGLSNLHSPGLIGDEDTLARWYAACDIYLTASRLETLGQTPIEAGLCGTPTLAYRATGLTSAVLDGVTGVLVDPRPGALAEGLEALIADAPRRARLGASARIVLENRFSHAASAMAFEAVFASWNAMADRAALERLRFLPEMLSRFACAADRHAGATGLVPAPSPPLVRKLRLAKQAVFGRGMPLWMRRALYAATLMRRGGTRQDLRR